MTMCYKNLVDIGLKNYLDAFFFYKIWEPIVYLERLDAFVGRKSSAQKDILLNKFKSLKDHTSVNDHIYELMVGIVFHPNGEFQENLAAGLSPDIVDNDANIEIKNINAEPEEIERVKALIPDSTSYGPFPDDTDYESRFRTKFKYRVDRAKQQIGNRGFIYIVWDTSLKGSTERKPKIEALLSELIKQESEVSPNVRITAIDFVDLREKVIQSNLD